MLKKLISNIFKYIKLEYKTIIIGVILLSMVAVPLPYYVITGGGIGDLENKVIIDNNYESKGSLNFSYVRELKGTPLTYLMSKIFNYELIKINDVKEENESIREYEERDKIYLSSSIDAATINAYKLANKEITITSSLNKVIYVYEKANTNLEVGDIILEINNQKINDISEYKDIINTKNIGEEISLLVNRNNKQVICYAKIIEIDDSKVIGIYLYQDKEYITNPKVEFKFSSKESGPSGGLMLTLAIYNKLTETDITKGLKIAGTGTIDEEGNVGEIGGVKYKLEGAVKAKADVFLSPSGNNYQECIALKKKNKYNIKIIEATNVEQVLESLKNI